MNVLIEKEKKSIGSLKVKFTDKIGWIYIRKHLSRTLMALCFALILSAFMTAMQAVTDNRAIAAGLNKQAEEPLPDLLMDWTTGRAGGAKIIPMYAADIFLNSLIAFTISCFLFSWRWRCQRYGLEEGHYRTFRLARKFFWMLGFAYLFRSFSLLSTTMPPTDPRCVYKQRNWKQIPFMAFEIMTKTGNTCSDKIFSGHSSMATLVCLFWLGALLRPDRSSIIHPQTAATTTTASAIQTEKVPLWRKFSAAFIVIWTFLVYIFCVLCRNHYSIDIIVAILVCSGIFSTFQLCLKVIELGQFNAVNFEMNQSSLNEFENNNNYNKNYNKNNKNNEDGLLLNAITTWPQQHHHHHYSPLKNDPEIGLESPQIHMKDIIQIDQEYFKPPFESVSKRPTSTLKISYDPGLFVLLLGAVGWMDGIDLKP